MPVVMPRDDAMALRAARRTGLDVWALGELIDLHVLGGADREEVAHARVARVGRERDPVHLRLAKEGLSLEPCALFPEPCDFSKLETWLIDHVI